MNIAFKFLSGASVPYFGCWALMDKILLKLLVLTTIMMLAGCTTSGAFYHSPKIAPVGHLPMSDNELAIYVDWPGFKEGTREANDSILRGQFVFYSYGLEIITEPQPKYYKRYDEFLAKNGVYIQNQGCELDNSGKAQGRNHTIALAVLKHYGADFWQRADSYARQSK